MIEYIKSDLFRYYGEVSLYLFIRNFLFNPSFKFTVFLRLCRSNNIIIAKVARVFHYHYGIKYAIKIHPSTHIGYGLYIGHGTSIVVNPTAIIGNNVSLTQFLSIGSVKGNAAIIGDNVYIGPNVSIVDDVYIGDNSTIGAGSVVVKDVSKYGTVVGNPGKIINLDSDGSLIVFKYPIPTL